MIPIAGHSTALHYSAGTANKKIVKGLLNRGVNVNARGEYGETPLYAAINSGNIKVIEVLLNWKAFVNVRNVFGTTPLYHATQRDRGNNGKIVELLLSRGAEFDAQGQNVTTVLHATALNEYLQIFQELLKHGASVSFVCADRFLEGYTPPHLAAENSRFDIAKLLLSSIGFVGPYTEDHWTPLNIGTGKGYVKVIKLFLEHWADVDDHNTKDTIRHLRIDRDCGKIVKLLLNSKADVDAYIKYDSATPLFVATVMRQGKTVKLLLKHKADDNAQAKDGTTVMHVAAQNGNLRIAELLSSNNARVDPYSNENLTPVFVATEMEHAEVAKLLLDHKAYVDAHDNYGQTRQCFGVRNTSPLIIEHRTLNDRDVNDESNGKFLDMTVYHVGYREYWKVVFQKLFEYRLLYKAADCSRNEYSRIVEYILRLGLNVNTLHIIQSERNQTLLHNATKNRWEKLAKLLISYGADVNVKDAAEKISLCYAIEENNEEEVAQLLRNFKGTINAIDKSGNTPMLEATKSTNVKMIELLLTYGTNIKDPELLNMVVQLGWGEIAEVVLRHNVDISSNASRAAFHSTAISMRTRRTNLRIFDRLLDRCENMEDIVKLLLNNIADVDAQSANSPTRLHNACAKGNTQVVKATLKYNNTDVNSTNADGNTPLCIAVKKGNETIVNMLLNGGADMNATGRDGDSPLAIATRGGHVKVVEMLLHWGAKVDSKCRNGQTPFLIAAQKGHLDILKLLFNFGADIESRDDFSRTALYFAANVGSVRVLTTVLEYGCDINTTSEDYCTVPNIGVSCFNKYLLILNHPRLYANSENSQSKILRILAQHLIKLKAANLYVIEKYSLPLPSSTDVAGYYFVQQCKSEVENMKSEKIGGSNVSLYDILTKSLSQLAVCVRNKSIVKTFYSHEYEIKFPIYGTMITAQLRKGMRRRDLLEEGIKLFRTAFNYSSELPSIVVEKIVSYLSNEDLKVLSKHRLTGTKNLNCGMWLSRTRMRKQ